MCLSCVDGPAQDTLWLDKKKIVTLRSRELLDYVCIVEIFKENKEKNN